MKVRGFIFIQARRWLEHSLDPGVLHRLMDSCEQECVEILLKAQKKGWYPITLLKVVFTELRQQGKTDLGEAAFGNWLCHATFNDSFHGLAAFVGPVTLVRRMHLFWERYFDEGELFSLELTKTAAEVRILKTEPSGFLTRLMTGWLEAAFRMVSAGEVRLESAATFRWKICWEH